MVVCYCKGVKMTCRNCYMWRPFVHDENGEVPASVLGYCEKVIGKPEMTEPSASCLDYAGSADHSILPAKARAKIMAQIRVALGVRPDFPVHELAGMIGSIVRHRDELIDFVTKQKP